MRIELLVKTAGRKILLKVPREGKTLLAILREHGIYMDAPCGGNGRCGRCLVLVTEPDMGECLACRVVPEWDCTVVLQEKGTADIAVNTDYTVQGVSGTRFSGHGAEGGCAEEDRYPTTIVREECVEENGFPMAAAEKERAEKDGNSMEVAERKHGYGIAVDIGTTTLEAVLVDLEHKAECAVTTAVNHQRAYGADVMSRIQCANEGQGEALRACICADLEKLMEDLVRQAEIGKDRVEHVVLAANTTMSHLLRGLSCKGLGAAPYTPEDISLWEGSWNSIFAGEPAWRAKVTILPGISAFVGGDITAGLFACEMDLRTEPGIFLDIGTNGEMAVGNREGFLVASAAAGPVFEGGNISCGVPGIPGAVKHLALNEGAVTCETIDGKPPVGLCGTGIIDAMGLLVEQKRMDENGTLEEPWFTEGVLLAGDSICFTQQDVREVQMGKAAIRAGIETLRAEYQKPVSDVLLAGGFGYDLNVSNAIRIGLFPANFAGKVHPVGNSAMEGAKRFLLTEETEAKKRIQRIVSRAREVSLALHPQFNELYLQYMFFEP